MDAKVFNTKYAIAKDGCVYNTKTDRLLKQQNHDKGYKQVTLTHGGIPKIYFVHRLVAIAYVSNPLNYDQVNHEDGNKTNNHFTNLTWCNNSINQIHAVKNGLKPIGNQLWNAKFSKENILEIKRLKSIGTKQIEIAKMFSTTKGTISEIVNNKRYVFV